MLEQKTCRGVTAIVPAYNEETRIGRVLQELVTYPFEEIIVIDDGSTDNTSNIAQMFDVRLIRNIRNSGKGAVMEQGVQESRSAVVFFCDADVIGLSSRIIAEIVEPVEKGRVDMFIGMRNRKIYYARFLLPFIPLLGGERACTRELWNSIPLRYRKGFKIETALNFFAKLRGRQLGFKVFEGLSQTIKEEKYGILRGLWGRIKMYNEIISANWDLYRNFTVYYRQSRWRMDTLGRVFIEK